MTLSILFPPCTLHMKTQIFQDMMMSAFHFVQCSHKSSICPTILAASKIVNHYVLPNLIKTIGMYGKLIMNFSI